MQSKIILFFFILLSLCTLGKSEQMHVIQSTPDENKDSLQWITELGKKGLSINEDSLVISQEFIKVMQDSSYRKLVYPDTYTWSQATQLIQSKELKKAFWYFINLYPQNDTNKEIIIRSILAYDGLFKMDEIMINTFYTYSFSDPEVSIIKDGKPEIIRPDILEMKLRNLKEIVGYIYTYRKQEEAN